ncbi:hypothetical protein LPJ61_004030, partial [Coemansia biformis]
MRRTTVTVNAKSLLLIACCLSRAAADTAPLRRVMDLGAPNSTVACTWNGVQLLDDVTWAPQPAYAFMGRGEEAPGPGPIDRDILRTVRKLTVEEKVGQLAQIQVGQLVDCNGDLNETAVDYWVGKWKVGSFLETPANHGGRYNWYSPKRFAAFTDAVQRLALKRGAKIPVIWGLDSVRGANY